MAIAASTLSDAMAHGGRAVLILGLLGCARAHRQFVACIPNGDVFATVWKAVGHISPLPQAISSAREKMDLANVLFQRNAFGDDFAAAGFTWGEAICRKDSDGDGKTNGEELGDPDCVWRPGSRPARNATLSHPGIAGARGRWEGLMRHARVHDCRTGHGCTSFGMGAAGRTTMETRHMPPAASIAIYHYYVVPLILLLGVCLYLCCPFAPAPRWPLVLFEAYLVCHVGVFIGCHRWAAHHQFVATPPLKWLLSILAAWCMQGTPAHWAFLHRLHHRFCDQGDLDLQAPRAPHYVLYGHFEWFVKPVDHFYMCFSRATLSHTQRPVHPMLRVRHRWRGTVRAAGPRASTVARSSPTCSRTRRCRRLAETSRRPRCATWPSSSPSQAATSARSCGGGGGLSARGRLSRRPAVRRRRRRATW